MKGVLPVLRWMIGPAILLGLIWVGEPGDLLARLAGMAPSWILVALGLSVAHVALSAWRWRFTAGQLGLRLPFSRALSEYYLATFLNQVLPGGVAGDVSRAWRSGPGGPEDMGRMATGRAVRAVLLERASGQMVMGAVAGLSFLYLLLPKTLGGIGWAAMGAEGFLGAEPRGVGVHPGLWTGGILIGLLGLLLFGVRHLARFRRRLGLEARRALFSRDALPLQLLSSTLVVASYLAMYLAAARAVNVDTPTAVLLPLVAPVLLSMLIPLSVAGWGIRESAAALLWMGAGLPAAEGVAISVAYGLLVLASSLPGALVLLAPGRRGRSRLQDTKRPAPSAASRTTPSRSSPSRPVGEG
jgi:glycosyltransferase 2 family protein